MTEQEPTADLQLTGFCVLPSGDVLLDLYAPGRMHHALVDYEGLREVADRVRRPAGPDSRNATCAATRGENLQLRQGSAPQPPAAPPPPAPPSGTRSAAGSRLHTRKWPAVWFSAFELCRVLHEQYACEAGESRQRPGPPSHRGRRPGRARRGRYTWSAARTANAGGPP